MAVAANDVAMTEGEAAAVARIGANERGFVDVLVAFLAVHKSHAIEQACVDGVEVDATIQRKGQWRRVDGPAP